MRKRIIVTLAWLAFAGCGGGGGAKNVCGDGKKGGTEVCDGNDVGGASCKSLGFAGGTLHCKATCGDFDRSACTAPTGCGDGTITAPEMCDGSNFGTATCQSLGFGPGTLACAANCADFDTHGCGAPATCGNGKRDTNEVCDGTDLGASSCKLQGFDGGTLKCTSSCMAFDTSACTKVCTPMCGARVCGADPVCGMSCGTCDAQSSCDPSGQCTKICDMPALTGPTQTLNEDLKVVTITGEVTLNGATMPNETGTNTRGSLRFTDLSNRTSVSVSLGTTGAATYSVTLFAATYDVTYVYASGQKVLPAMNHQLDAGLAVSQNAQKTYDLKTVTASGEVTLNGATIPDEAGGNTRGNIRFTEIATAAEMGASLGTTGPATYSLTLYTGTYKVTYFGDSAQRVLPTLNHQFDASVTLNQDTQKTYDLRVVTVSGEITVNGTTVPDETGATTRGTIQFAESATGATRLVDLPMTGPATYSVTLYAGTYDVMYFYASGQKALLGMNHVLDTGFAVSQAMQKSYDLRTVTVSGEVTLNGATMPDETGTNTRGEIRFTDPATSSYISASLKTTGAATYSLTLYAGTYDVKYVYASGQKVLPALNHVFAPGLAISQSMQKTYDLHTVTVSGEVTLNGATMPDETGSNTRGEIRFTEPISANYQSASLKTTGAATYSLTMYAGTYEVRYVYSSGQRVLPAISHSFNPGVTLSQDVQQSYDLQTVTVSGEVTLNGATMPNETGTNTRGSLQFTDRMTASEAGVSLRTTGAATYSVTIFSGAYDVGYAYSSPQTVLPQLNTRLQHGCLSTPTCSGTVADVSGTWQLIFDDSANFNRATLTLSQQGGAVTGTWTVASATAPLNPGTFQGGTLDVSFNFQYERESFHGVLLNGCLMTGSTRSELGGLVSGVYQTSFTGLRSP